jgi:hypothetical protein
MPCYSLFRKIENSWTACNVRYGRSSESLPKIFRPVRQEGHMLLLPLMLEDSAIEKAWRPWNHKINLPTADVRNGPCCYSNIPCTSIKFPHSQHVKFLFGNRVNLKLINLGHLYKTSKRFLMVIFRPSTEFTQFLFSNSLRFWFGSFWITATLSVEMYLQMYGYFFSIWICNMF